MKLDAKENRRPSIDEIFLKPGLTYQGKPCKHGHAGIRYVRGGECVDCQKRYNSKAYRGSLKHRAMAA